MWKLWRYFGTELRVFWIFFPIWFRRWQPFKNYIHIQFHGRKCSVLHTKLKNSSFLQWSSQAQYSWLSFKGCRSVDWLSLDSGVCSLRQQKSVLGSVFEPICVWFFVSEWTKFEVFLALINCSTWLIFLICLQNCFPIFWQKQLFNNAGLEKKCFLISPDALGECCYFER